MGTFKIGDKVVITDFFGILDDIFIAKHNQQGYVTIDGIIDCPNTNRIRRYCPTCNNMRYSFKEKVEDNGDKAYWCAMNTVMKFYYYVGRPKEFNIGKS